MYGKRIFELDGGFFEKTNPNMLVRIYEYIKQMRDIMAAKKKMSKFMFTKKNYFCEISNKKLVSFLLRVNPSQRPVTISRNCNEDGK